MADLLISNRLNIVSEICGQCETFADVGCDHGLLSIHMVNNKLAKFAILSDVNKGPLNAAKKNINEFADDKSKFDLRLGNGLSVLKNNEADVIAICGMGGLLIAEMLKNAPDIAKNSTLVLEPNTCIPELRKFLYDNGYAIIDEVGISDKNIPYIILKVRYNGGIIEYDESYLYLGEYVWKRKNCDDINYLMLLRKKYKNILEGISKIEKTDFETKTKKEY